MTFKEIAKRIDKSENNQNQIDWDRLCEELDIYFYGYLEQERLKCYWINNWICTDTYVGGRMYFLDDVPVAYSFQDGRKSDERFRWFSQELAEQVRDYLLSIIPKEELSVQILDLDHPFGDSYKIGFNACVIDWSRARYKGEPIEFIERIRKPNEFDCDTLGRYRLPSGEEVVLDIEDIDFLFHVN